MYSVLFNYSMNLLLNIYFYQYSIFLTQCHINTELNHNTKIIHPVSAIRGVILFLMGKHKYLFSIFM